MAKKTLDDKSIESRNLPVAGKRMAKKSLTDKFIKSIKSSDPLEAGERVDYHDALVPGLALRVTARGHKSFVLVARYPQNPKNPTRRTLGVYGALTLEAARVRAREWLELIAKGIDPMAEKESARTTAIKEAQRLNDEEVREQRNCFSAVAAQYIAAKVKGTPYLKLEGKARALCGITPELTQKKAMAIVMAAPENKKLVLEANEKGLVKKDDVTRIILDFVGLWDTRHVKNIKPHEVSAAIEDIVDRGTPCAAHNAFAYLRALFNWAIGSGKFDIEFSPLDRLRPKDVIGKRRPRTRTLSDKELRLIWNAAEQLGYPYGPLIRMLMMVGQRKLEIGEISWNELDFENQLLTIPEERMKARRVHEVPLPPAVLELLNSLPRQSGPYIFSTTDGMSPVNGFSKVKSRLDYLIALANAKARLSKADKSSGNAVPKRSGKKCSSIAVEPEEQDYLPHWVLHDLRRTMRTRLSKFPGEDYIRELIISHAKGLHAVYDQHLYRDEKRALLENHVDDLLNVVSESKGDRVQQEPPAGWQPARLSPQRQLAESLMWDLVPDGLGGSRVRTTAEIEAELVAGLGIKRTVALSAATKAVKALDPENPARRSHKKPVARSIGPEFISMVQEMRANGHNRQSIADATGADIKTVGRHWKGNFPNA